MSIIEVNNITKSYEKKQIINMTSFSINDSKIYGFIGPSGAGKTTLIRMLVGMEKPTTGTIKVLNKNIPSFNTLKNIGYMAQSDALYEELTGIQNLKFYGDLYSLTKTEFKENSSYILDLVNLNDAKNIKVSNYSGGMKRRLSLAIALIHNPDILVLDEPTVGIDPKLRKEIWSELYKLSTTKTILVTTHIMDEAEKCNKLFMISNGSIISSGTPNEILTNFKVNNLEDAFIKAGDM